MQIDDLRIYIAVIHAGNFTAAAEQLMLSKQYVSRRMAALEASLGVRLLIRNTRKLSVTDAGQLFAQHAQRILDEIQEAELAVSEQHQALRGTFRINLPMSFGMSHLSPLIAEFLSHHPALQFQIELADRYVDVIGEGVDMAIRIGTLADSTLIARPLGELKRVICCSPGYLQRAGTPQQPEELLQHACLRYGREGQNGWELQVNGKAKWLSVQGPMVSNNGEVLRDAALAGLGLVLLPAFIVETALQRGELVTVLDGCQPPPLSLNAVYPQHRQRSEVNRQLLAFLQTRLAP
ncbi:MULTISPECIES: LysR family transcriptional regulator [Pantoea]|uniref:LysR family transcriptional regulator n=1 Tax=Candidatus Pantoea gossypiicola TaxID=2608008 RepID=A0AB34CLB3_9GAMM|nr:MULTISPECIES: LysR family transcriptional regulator [Pantoea]KAA5931446.1 LysR family transcriptional regulator [Pantoea sp. VH_8]KAA5936581.1 LysR family transcriptional regulator [Pantoea sp. VH_4]KAA5987851.1 LysR family transcriptional regulator [Pantoea sp. M_4]KAA6126923.1 LysR family transcriptional regulator [Pantoea gossypiicola]